MRAHNFKDITGQRFGRLVVIKFVGIDKENRALWLCRCDCGNEIIVSGKNLRSGNTKSCGCLNIENATKRIVEINTTHGKTYERLYHVWKSMRGRCNDPHSNSYKSYGQKGIKVCEEWENNFEAFYNWAIENGYDKTAKRGEYTIDRINLDLGYFPENCRLTNSAIQADNRKTTRHITFNGMTKNLADWARYYGKSKARFEGLSDEEIIYIMNIYENYKKYNNTNILPYRINFAKYESLR